jgi:hypothetical protein
MNTRTDIELIARHHLIERRNSASTTRRTHILTRRAGA